MNPGARAPRPPAPPGVPPGGVRAFTLIELLVVIGILLLLMGLSVASVVRGPKLQRMIAAEQVVADCVRQARHTARTSGQPVVLKLKKGERAIGGLVRTVLWHGVEGPSPNLTWPQTEMQEVSGAWVRFDAPGRTGLGLQLKGAFTSSGVLDATRADWGTPAWDEAVLLAGSKRLWRGVAPSTSGQRPGLLLSVAVMPPLATAGAPQVLPLALVADSTQGLGNYDASPLGLALVLATAAGGSGPKASKASQKVAPTWEIVGWFGLPKVEVSSIANRPKDFLQRDVQTSGSTMKRDLVGDELRSILMVNGSPQADYSESGALVGGRWTEIGLLVQGDRLVLYRDGRRVGENTGALSTGVPPGLNEQVYVGVATLDATGPTIATGATLDDVRLERLGDALAGTLPGGVVPDQERQIICHPDGRVEVDANSGDDKAVSISLTSDSGERAELVITTTGAVSSLTTVAP